VADAGEAVRVMADQWTEAAELAQERLAKVERIALDLARALMACQSYLPLFIVQGRKLDRAIAVDDRAKAALDAFCAYADTTPAELWRTKPCPPPPPSSGRGC